MTRECSRLDRAEGALNPHLMGLGDAVAIEVKAKASVAERDLRGLRALREEVKLKQALVVSLERSRRETEDGILILPVQEFFDGLWASSSDLRF